ncbi:5-methylcytosine restriction system specificity protein McrC [Sphingobacterium sp. LRF_L2]|uniref:5-methylcytosine restriction system specificity protein McrC n=1 Tax=Sphingobacterium sp. LRF_L2 TaxID=3369421 RepID=UPI003F62A2DF
MKISLYEHVKHILFESDTDGNLNSTDEMLKWSSCVPRMYKDRRGQEYNCFHVISSKNKVELTADYHIGVDWLVVGEKYVHVQPKLNKYVIEKFAENCTREEQTDVNESEELNDEANNIQVNYLKMLLDAMSDPIVAKECADLVRIEWEDQPINIEQEDDSLTPFLVVQFLQLIRQIVRKGLKKSYYKERENLNNRVKGKILVGQQVKQNILKNRFTKTYCEYQVFGEDNIENRFLKKVLNFVSAYIGNHQSLFQGNGKYLEELINYVRPSFEHISNLADEDTLRYFKYNPFFKEYKEAVRIGGYILKRFGYNISRTTANERVDTPPFWIDMPRLFELYVYQKLLQANGHNTEKIKYQYSTYGNSLDILVKDGENSMIIDAKYKLQYKSHLVHEDIRQVAGYARLNRVLHEVSMGNNEFDRDTLLPCLIIYPDMVDGLNLEGTKKKIHEQFALNIVRGLFAISEHQVKAYHKVYKIGVKLPVLLEKV